MPKSTVSELLSSQNTNVARFARNVECDILDDFQTLWITIETHPLFSTENKKAGERSLNAACHDFPWKREAWS